MKRIKMLVFVLFLLCNFLNAQENKSTLNPPPVPINGTHLIHFKSAVTNQDYDLYINLPRQYNDSTKSFPVLFLVDAQWDFTLIQSIYGQQYYDGFVPDLVIVGITWGGENPNYDLRRQFDLTTSSVQPSVHSGNAPKFLECIKKEIIPFIESNYRVKKERTLLGSSLGGLFTLYTMFTETNLFNRYFLTSPALHLDNDILFKIEKSFSEKNSSLPVKLFIGIGEYENTSDLKNFADLLKGRNYKGLEIETRVIEGCGHSGAKAEGYTRGIQFVYQRPSLKLSKSILDQYIGKYEIFPNMYASIEIENDQLNAVIPVNGKFKLFAETENDFYIKGGYLLIHFEKDNSGKVKSVIINTYDRKQIIKKAAN